MSGRRSLAFCCLIGGALWSSTAVALEGGPPSIWYRSADGCPDGAAFVSRLHGAAEGSKLASVADRIDFVVTLGMQRGRAFGRLERQTAEGRAAVRELSAATCDEVADAIALTLTLALEPRPNAASPPNATSVPASGSAAAEPASDASAPSRASEPPPAAEPSRAETSLSPITPRARIDTRRPITRKPHWIVGDDFTAEKGAFHDLLLGSRLFVEGGADAPWRGSSLRAAVFFMRRSLTRDPALELVRVGGRLEACPFALVGGALELSPCLGLDVGIENARGTASSGVSASGTWVAASGLARGVWHAAGPLNFEAAAGPSLPLTRYSLIEKDSRGVIHRTEFIGLSVALGVALELR